MKTIAIFVGLISATASVSLAAPALSTSTRNTVTYTDANNVQYYQDATGQWWVYPTPSPVPPTPSPAPAPGSSIEIDGLNAGATGDNSVSVGATDDKAAASSNGLNGALAAALASPGAPTALGLAF